MNHRLLFQIYLSYSGGQVLCRSWFDKEGFHKVGKPEPDYVPILPRALGAFLSTLCAQALKVNGESEYLKVCGVKSGLSQFSSKHD